MATPHNNTNIGLAVNGLPEFRCPMCNSVLARVKILNGTFSTLCHRCGKALKSTVVILIEVIPKPQSEEAGKSEGE